MNTAYHHGGLKSALLTSAQRLMESGQIDKLSMREMAKSLGVSHTAAYRHFANKRELLNAVAARGFEDMLRQCEAAVLRAPNHPRSRLKASGLAYVEFGLSSPRLLAHMFHSASMPDAGAPLRDASSKLFDSLVTLIIDGQEQGMFRPDNSRSLAHACWAMVHGLSVLLSLSTTPDQKHNASIIDAELAIDTFLDGVALT